MWRMISGLLLTVLLESQETVEKKRKEKEKEIDNISQFV